MTISATYIGQSTVQVSCTSTGGVLSGLTTFMQLATTVADAMVGTQPSAVGANSNANGTPVTFAVASGITAQASSGWTLIDSWWGGKDATQATQSPVYTQVFRSPTLDGASGSYKNIMFRWNVPAQELNVYTGEYFGDQANYQGSSYTPNSNKTLSNQAWTFFDSATIGFNTTACDLIIMVNPGWCMVHSYLNNEPSLWAGVVEFQREDPYDVGAAAGLNWVPNWGWVSSTLPTLGCTAAGGNSVPLNGTTGTGTSYTLLSCPRLRSGATGISAAYNYAADYASTVFPGFSNNGTTTFPYQIGNQVNKFLYNKWGDASKRLIMPIKPIFDYAGTTIENKGIINGIKIAGPIGSNMTKLNVPVDSYGNASSSGTDRPHWLLNLHHKTAGTDLTSLWSNTTIVAESINLGSSPMLGMVSIGEKYYAFNALGIYKIVATAVPKTVTQLTTNGATTYTDIAYDGERYVYVTSTNVTYSLIRIDTLDDSLAYFAVATNGLGAIAINNDGIYCAQGTSSGTPIIYRFTKPSVTAIVGSVPAIAAASTASVTSPSITTTGIVMSMVSDFEGNIWASPAQGISTPRLIKVTGTIASAGAISLYTYTPVGGTTCTSLLLLDGTTMFQLCDNSNSSLYIQVINPTQASVATTTLTVPTKTASMAAGPAVITQKNSAFKIQGTVFSMARPSAANAMIGQSVFWTTANPIVAGNTAISGAVGTTLSLPINACFYHDHSRLSYSTATGFNILTNLNGGNNVGGNQTATVSLGQVLVPA